MERCVIVGGATIGNYKFVRDHIRDTDYVIYCDCGLSHMESLGAAPSLIVGDFDSHENPHMDVETIVLPTVKDDTDTVYAVKEGIKRGFTDFLLVGVLGKRFDHSLGNLAILLMLDSEDLSGMIVDDYSEITVLSGGRDTNCGCAKEADGVVNSFEEGNSLGTDTPVTAEITDSCKYFSLLAAGGDAHGVTIVDAKYNIEDADLTTNFPLGVSNEVPAGNIAKVSIKEGRLFLIKIFSE